LKNAYFDKLRNTKDKAYTDGFWAGMKIAFNITAIALNRVFGFGEERIKRLETKVQDLVDELISTKDPLVNQAHIEEAVKQIRGKAWNT
jgi:hypothetical protein